MKVKEFRELKGYTQQHVANILKIDRTTYVRKELGIRGFNVKELLLLEEVLSASISKLFAEEKEELMKK